MAGHEFGQVAFFDLPLSSLGGQFPLRGLPGGLGDGGGELLTGLPLQAAFQQRGQRAMDHQVRIADVYKRQILSGDLLYKNGVEPP